MKMENTKRDLSLDFTKPRIPRGQPAPGLVTPVLNLSTPELNKMISEDELAVLTPNGISSVIPQTNILPSPLIPTSVNNSNNIINNSNNSNNASHHLNHHSNTASNTHHSVKKSASPDSGNNKRNIRQEIDMEKIEKKRERNRLAAKKCRQRKLETIDELRKEVSQWEQKYKKLEIDFEQFKNIRNKEIEDLHRENAYLKNLPRR